MQFGQDHILTVHDGIEQSVTSLPFSISQPHSGHFMSSSPNIKLGMTFLAFIISIIDVFLRTFFGNPFYSSRKTFRTFHFFTSVFNHFSNHFSLSIVLCSIILAASSQSITGTFNESTLCGSLNCLNFGNSFSASSIP